MRRMHLKRQKRTRKIGFLIFGVLLLILLLFIKFINIKPLIISYSEVESNKLATLIINTALKDADISDGQIYEIKDKIINYDTPQINAILTKLTTRIQSIFTALENGNIESIEPTILENYNYQTLKEGTILKIPMGYFMGSSFLANLGPKIPLKIKLIGDVKTDVKEKVTDYGLNNALLKIYIYIEVTTQSIIPFISNVQKTIVEYPIVLKLIEGEVPNYYLGNR